MCVLCHTSTVFMGDSNTVRLVPESESDTMDSLLVDEVTKTAPIQVREGVWASMCMHVCVYVCMGGGWG